MYIYDASGSVEGVPVTVGGDFNIIPDLDKNKTYYGATLTGGFALGSPGGEFHVEWGKTHTIAQFNVYDLAKYLYIKIMEW